MLPLIGLFIALPILELYAIVKVGGLIGILPTLALLLGSSLLGAALLRHQGRGAWQRFNRALTERRFPGREVADGLMITGGGVLLVVPGFITDAFGLFLLFPPTRAIVRRLGGAYVARRFVVVGMGTRSAGTGYDATGRPYDFDATAEEVKDSPELSG